MNITYENIIEYLTRVIPEIKNAPGYDEHDNARPHVAFASILPFVASNKLLDPFIITLSDIYEYTQDKKILNLIFIELFEDAVESYENKLETLGKTKLIKDWRKFIEIRNSIKKDGIWRPYINSDGEIVYHIGKVQENISSLREIINNPKTNEHDKNVAEVLINKLQNSLNTTSGGK